MLITCFGAVTTKTPSSKSNSNNLVFNEILKKLEKFEEKNKFTEKGLTLNKLAKNFNTNSTYLSLVISENRNLNFNKYLSELRINYITQKLYNDRTKAFDRQNGLMDDE